MARQTRCTGLRQQRLQRPHPVRPRRGMSGGLFTVTRVGIGCGSSSPGEPKRRGTSGGRGPFILQRLSAVHPLGGLGSCGERAPSFTSKDSVTWKSLSNRDSYLPSPESIVQLLVQLANHVPHTRPRVRHTRCQVSSTCEASEARLLPCLLKSNGPS